MTHDRRVVAVVQARLGSSRLPAKVLAPLAGRAVIHRVVSRLQRARRLDQIVIATTWLDEDDPLAAFVSAQGWQVYRGHPTDLLSRYVAAATAAAADVVVRVTSDCPMIDPDLVDVGVELLFERGVDYASNTLEPRTYPRGLDSEVMTMAALLRADAEDRDPGTREHVTPHIKESAGFTRASYACDRDLSAIRWTVDTAEDLSAVRAVFDHFDCSDTFTWTEALSAWESHPEWAELNRHVEQKPVVRQLEQ